MDTITHTLMLEELLTTLVLERKLLVMLEINEDPGVRAAHRLLKDAVDALTQEIATYEQFLKPGHYNL